MKTRDEVVSILRAALPELAREYGVTRLGSYARGDQRDDSDVDVLVDVDPKIGLRFVDLAERIEQLMGRPTDVISMRALKPRDWSSIEREMVDVR